MQLRSALIILLATSACTTPNPVPNQTEALSWGHDFYYASASATGYALCDPALREYSSRAFRNRFGARFKEYRDEHQKRFGKPQPAISVSSCQLWSKPVGDYATYHSQALDEFEEWLKESEDKLQSQPNKQTQIRQ